MEKWYYLLWGVHAVFAVVTIVDLYRNPRFQGALRIMLLLPMIVVPIIGPLIYLLLRDAEVKERSEPKNK